jgi:hypothetical protein
LFATDSKYAYGRHDPNFRLYEFYVNGNEPSAVDQRLKSQVFTIPCLILSKCIDSVAGYYTRYDGKTTTPKSWDNSDGNPFDKANPDGTVNHDREVPNEDFVVDSEKNVLYDIVYVAGGKGNFRNLEIKGRVVIDGSTDIKMIKLKQIFINRGELDIDYSGVPDKKLEIVFTADQQHKHVFTSNSVEAGNNGIINAGTLKIKGWKPDNPVVRLVEWARKDSTTIKVELNKASGWRANDWIGFAPTNYSPSEYEKVQIASIDVANGLITLATALVYDHYGSSSALGVVEGVDTRGEVLYLSSNVVIRTEQPDSWHGTQIVTTEPVPIVDTTLEQAI